MTIHTGEMPHECHICGRRVRVLSNLYKHYMVHKKNKTYYSKKDGLPDPLDAYIVEQQKRKQVNKIVEQNSGPRAGASEEANSTTRIADNPEGVKNKAEENVSLPMEIIAEGTNEPELKVNRSSNRITYRGPTATATPTTENTPQNFILIL